VKLLRPRQLSPGATLGIVAPASAAADPQTVDRAIAVLEQLGYQIKRAANVHKRFGYLAGTDYERAQDLMQMFTDQTVEAILCVRGGYGAARLLPLLDYQLIRANPKMFVGYSDLTSIHCALLTKAGLISFHGPMLDSEFTQEDLPHFTIQSFLRCLASGNRPADIAAGYLGKTVKILRRGRARGPLIGGNLSLLDTMIGTPWEPSFRNCILFLEDVGEAPYRWDRMLTHLLNCGRLQQVAGIAIGLNADCTDPKAKRAKEYRQTLEDVLRERLLPLKIPIVTGLPFGHVPHNATLPFGARAELDADHGRLSLLDPVLS